MRNMVYGGYSYIDYEYEPKKDDFRVLMWVDGKYPIEKLAEGVAAESSVGTWTKISTMNERVFQEYRARVYEIVKVQPNAGFIYIAYPFDHFDTKNITQFMASVLGNLFGLKELTSLYVLDISFPERYQKIFDGPVFGLKGIRKYMGTDKTRRPHIGTIVKPKVGLTPKEFSEVAYKAWVNGLDLVKDDENLVDQPFCPWKERFDRTIEKLHRAEDKTGERKLYASNVTDSDLDRMMARMDYIAENGGKLVMLDVYVLGIPAAYTMINYAHELGLFVHAHRAGYSAHHRGNFGVNFQIYEKFYRLLGVDQLHIGTGVGKMEGSPIIIKRFHDIAVKNRGEEKFYIGSLDFVFARHIKPFFPVASGGVDPGRVDALLALHGRDVIIQAGGGVHGHPRGTAAGARAMRAAVEAAVSGSDTPTAAKKDKDLALAIKKFGYLEPSSIKKILDFEKKNKEFMEHLVKTEGINGYRSITEDYDYW